jgi:hypothetical protein
VSSFELVLDSSAEADCLAQRRQFSSRREGRTIHDGMTTSSPPAGEPDGSRATSLLVAHARC